MPEDSVYKMRLIKKEDNTQAAKIVRAVLAEFGCSGDGFACNDADTDDLYTAYQKTGSSFWVIVNTQTAKIAGGGGFSQLKGTELQDGICELQKFYFLPELRGKGFGKKLFDLAINEAITLGYNYMYIETVPQMQQAISLYHKFGFEFIGSHMGNTGHQNNCSVFMLNNIKKYKENVINV